MPDIPYIQESIQQYIDENRNVDIFIAPLSICRNVYGEIDFMSEQRNDYYATVLATLFKADEILLSTLSTISTQTGIVCENNIH